MTTLNVIRRQLGADELRRVKDLRAAQAAGDSAARAALKERGRLVFLIFGALRGTPLCCAISRYPADADRLPLALSAILEASAARCGVSRQRLAVLLGHRTPPAFFGNWIGPWRKPLCDRSCARRCQP